MAISLKFPYELQMQIHGEGRWHPHTSLSGSAFDDEEALKFLDTCRKANPEHRFRILKLSVMD